MKNTPANPCVIAHFIGRGACVYCRLLSVLLMQIIKFGGKLVVNPHCFSIERHDFKRNKANFRILLVDGLHCREQQNIALCSWARWPCAQQPGAQNVLSGRWGHSTR